MAAESRWRWVYILTVVTLLGAASAAAAQTPLAPTCTLPGQGACTDYFGVPNWTNSPLPLVAPGPISGIAVTKGGGGYQNPVVSITDPTGTGAVAEATTRAGVVTAIAVIEGGSNYSAPVVEITDENGIAAGARATVTAFGNATGGVRKFVNSLPRLTPSGANNLGTYIPLAVPDTSTFPGSDFYRIGLKEFTHQFHSDLPGPCTTASTGTVCAGAAPATSLRGYYDKNNPADGANHYLGPFVLATRNRPVRVLFSNELTTDLNLPVDTTYMGAGLIDDGTHRAMASLRRATLHLHGGNSPWISDGTPMQWITPAGGDGQPAAPGFAKGFSFQNVPDMPPKLGFTPSLTDGLATFLWTNQQSGRLMFYHDHAYGLTRLNVYAGEAAGYLLVDPAQEGALAAASVPGTIVTDAASGAIVQSDLPHLVPLIIQDKSFVPPPPQLAATDPTWDVAQFGGLGSLWFPHVYTPNQWPENPDLSGANPFGRWDYGMWFWPPQRSLTYPEVPCTTAAAPGAFWCPGTPNPSGTPEAFMDTPVVNGTAYPSLDLTPSAYRFHILSAGNDRAWNLGLYYAVDKNGAVCRGGSLFDAASCTEVSLVPAVPTANPCAENPGVGASGLTAALIEPASGSPLNGTGLQDGCWPATWPTDGRGGGVPDPTTAGPPFIQIASEGGLLPRPAVIPSTPVDYEYNRRSATLLNVSTHGLFLGPAERADVIVDFSTVPSGSVLLLYNDGPAHVPLFDPRNDYYTGSPDLRASGGAPTTQRGYGPNTRTVMQIKVSGANDNATPFSLAAVSAALPGIFTAVQDPMIVPETAYPAGNGGSTSDTYARIEDTTLSLWMGGPLGGFTITSSGEGYTAPPVVTVTGGGGSGATATGRLVPTTVAGVALTARGTGYTAAPNVTLSGGGGTGAIATATLAPTTVARVTLTNQGRGYTSVPTVTFSPPQAPGGTPATGVAVVRARRITAINLTAPGTGYTSSPSVSITGGGGTGATATAALAPAQLGSLALSSRGSGYTSPPTVSFSGGTGSGAAATATLTPTGVASLSLNTGGDGYRSAPNVTIAPPPGGGAAATAVAAPTSLPLHMKAIQELFTLDYGRMNSTLGVEVPLTSFLTQTTIPYNYVDPATEVLSNGETQLWKITHNGVDTHFVHFHLVTVQVINRVGWDGAIKPPDANELGWKDTVRMNPFEDIIVALKAKLPLDTLGITAAPGQPFRLPNSIRPLDVTMPVGSAAPNEFTGADPTNATAPVTNALVNYGWEYVWHCHLLGHEENDMMRPLVVAAPPQAPGLSATAARNGRYATATLTLTDNSGNATEFALERALSPAGPWVLVANVPSPRGARSPVRHTDSRLERGRTYYYRVTAINTVGYTRAYNPPAVGYPTVSSRSASVTTTISTP